MQPRGGCEFFSRPEQTQRSSGSRGVMNRSNCRNCAALVSAYCPTCPAGIDAEIGAYELDVRSLLSVACPDSSWSLLPGGVVAVAVQPAWRSHKRSRDAAWFSQLCLSPLAAARPCLQANTATHGVEDLPVPPALKCLRWNELPWELFSPGRGGLRQSVRRVRTAA
jgi:hypothetical protein